MQKFYAFWHFQFFIVSFEINIYSKRWKVFLRKKDIL
jgi:hypothetical protein